MCILASRPGCLSADMTPRCDGDRYPVLKALPISLVHRALGGMMLPCSLFGCPAYPLRVRRQ